MTYPQCHGTNSATGKRCEGKAGPRSGLCEMCRSRRKHDSGTFKIHPAAVEQWKACT